MKWGRPARRLSATHSTIVAYLALAVALSGTAVAATGSNFILGQSNQASGPTALTTARGPALDLHTGDRAPFRVDSSARVANLNADAVDGLSSGELQRRVTGTCSAGQFLTGVDPSGAVGCGTPADPLNGLTVSDLQKKLSGTCSGGQFLTGVDPSGAVTCDSPALNVYTVYTPADPVHQGSLGGGNAWCHDHDVVTGGGFLVWPRVSDAAVPQITVSAPMLNVGMPGGDSPPADPAMIGHNGWVVEATTTSDSPDQAVSAFAMCAHLGPLN